MVIGPRLADRKRDCASPLMRRSLAARMRRARRLRVKTNNGPEDIAGFWGVGKSSQLASIPIHILTMLQSSLGIVYRPHADTISLTGVGDINPDFPLLLRQAIGD